MVDDDVRCYKMGCLVFVGRAMAPVISKLSSRYPKIPIYKVDIDMVSGRIQISLRL